MAVKFNPGDTAYLIESNRFVREVVILKSGGFYTIRFRDGGGGIKVRENRLYSSKKEAESAVAKAHSQEKQTRSHRDYM